MIDLRALVYRELKLFFNSKVGIVLSLITPAVYLLLFSTSMSGLMPTMAYRSLRVSYAEFFLPGILTLSVFSTSMTMAQSLYNEQLSQMLYQLLSNPVRKSAYVLAKVLAGTMVATIQAAIFLLVGAWLFSPTWSWTGMGLVLIVCALVAICLGSLFQALCGMISSMQTFIVLTNVLYSILLFTSPIFYPLEAMPILLRGIALFNPVTYAVNVLRDVLLLPGLIRSSDLIALISITIVAIFLAVRVMMRRLQTI